MVHVAAGASELPQLFVCAKAEEFAPVTVTPLMFNASVPGLESVLVIAALVVPAEVLGKVRLVGDKTACATSASVPVPANAIVCGDVAALSATLMEAEKVPVAAGRNKAEIVQLAPADREMPQLFVAAKSAAFAPASVMPERFSVSVP